MEAGPLRAIGEFQMVLQSNPDDVGHQSRYCFREADMNDDWEFQRALEADR
jgi:hypothetical protein